MICVKMDIYHDECHLCSIEANYERMASLKIMYTMMQHVYYAAR